MLAAIDLEKGSAVEYAVTQILGMPCTGCERKLQRVLSSIAGVYNVKTSLVLGRAEFDVDAGLLVNEVTWPMEVLIIHPEWKISKLSIAKGESGSPRVLLVAFCIA